MTIAACLLSRSLLGAKRTCPFALHMSANDPKRTFGYGCGSPANLSVFHDFSRGVAARMALKGALVVVGCVRLDPSKPHLCAAFCALGVPQADMAPENMPKMSHLDDEDGRISLTKSVFCPF
jgi:hypothetical protein